MTSDWITSKICDSISCCRKQFDVINYVTSRWVTCRFMRLPTLQFGTKLQKDNHIQNFHLGGISSDICSENFRPYIRRYISPNENIEYINPLNFRENFIFANIFKRHICHVQKSRLGPDLSTSVNDRVISPFHEGFT